MGNLIIPYWAGGGFGLTPSLLLNPDVMLLADDENSINLTGGLTSWTSLVSPFIVFTNVDTISSGDRILHTNGRHAVRASETVRLNGNIVGWTGGTTVISVGQFNHISQPNDNFDYLYQIIRSFNNTGASFSRWANAPNKDDMYSFDGNTPRFGPPIVGQRTYVFTQRFNTAAPFQEVWFDSVSQVVEDHVLPINANGAVNLFGFDGGGLGMLGQIQIFLLYKTALSDTDRLSVENTLKTYYSIP